MDAVVIVKLRVCNCYFNNKYTITYPDSGAKKMLCFVIASAEKGPNSALATLYYATLCYTICYTMCYAMLFYVLHYIT